MREGLKASERAAGGIHKSPLFRPGWFPGEMPQTLLPEGLGWGGGPNIAGGPNSRRNHCVPRLDGALEISIRKQPRIVEHLGKAHPLEIPGSSQHPGEGMVTPDCRGCIFSNL